MFFWFFFAFVGTCVGVLLAFFLTDYQERKNDQERLEKVMVQIKLEIEKNLSTVKKHSVLLTDQAEAIEKMKPYIKEDTLIIATEAAIREIQAEHPDFFVPENKTPYRDSLFKWNGDLALNFNVPGISDIAWRNAQALDILHLVDFNTSYQLFSLYTFQNHMKEEALVNFERLKNGIDVEDSEAGFLQLFFEEYYRGIKLLSEFEKDIIEFYQVNLDKLNEKYAD